MAFFSLFLVAIPQIFAQVNRPGFLLVCNVVNAKHFLRSRSRGKPKNVVILYTLRLRFDKEAQYLP